MSFGVFTEHYGESSVDVLADEEPYSIRIVELKEGSVVDSSMEDLSVTLSSDMNLKPGLIIKPKDSETIWVLRHTFFTYRNCVGHINNDYQESSWEHYRQHWNTYHNTKIYEVE